MQFLSLHPAAAQPGANGDLPDIEHLFVGIGIDAQVEEPEDLLVQGGVFFQAIEDGVFTAGKFLLTSLAFEILDRFAAAVQAVADEGVDVFVGNGVVFTGLIGTEENLLWKFSFLDRHGLCVGSRV